MLGLTALAFTLHLVWGLTLPAPVDADPAYYQLVAQRIATGQGATSSALGFVGWLPDALPMAADSHWMPLPSRVLVPGVWLSAQWGTHVTSALLAALWVPLAMVIARHWSPHAELLAGVLAACGVGYARFASSGDSMALYGLLGGAAVVALQRDKPLVLAGLAALAALTRGEGLLLVPLLAAPLVLRRRRLAAAAVAGPLAWAIWQLRCVRVFGRSWWGARSELGAQLDYAAFAAGVPGAADWGDRALFVLQELPGQAVVIGLAGAALGVPLALVGAGVLRARPVVRGVVLTGAALPILALALAPAVAASGTVFRAVSALAPAGCALAAVGVTWASAWAVKQRDYPAWLLPGLAGAGVWIASLAQGAATVRAMPSAPPVCHETADHVVLAAQPHRLALACGHRTVLLPAAGTPEGIGALAERYDVWLAVPQQTPGGVGVDDARAGSVLGPTWRPHPDTPGLWVRSR
jgi:hypothetical protein